MRRWNEGKESLDLVAKMSNTEPDKTQRNVGGPKRKVFAEDQLPSNLLTGEKVAWKTDLQRTDLKYGKFSEEEDATIMGAMREYSTVRISFDHGISLIFFWRRPDYQQKPADTGYRHKHSGKLGCGSRLFHCVSS